MAVAAAAAQKWNIAIPLIIRFPTAMYRLVSTSQLSRRLHHAEATAANFLFSADFVSAVMRV
jgi:hypothetical protein